MPFNEIYRLRVYQRMHGAQVVNVMHFVQDDPLPTNGALQLAQDFVTNMRPTLIARACNQLTFEFVEVQTIVPFSGGPVAVNFPANTVGTVFGSSASATLCEVITLYSSRGGRRGRGRIYLAGANTNQDLPVQGVWASSQTTKTQAFATALASRYMAEFGGGTIGLWRLGVWSKASGPEHPPWSTDQFVRATALTVRTIIRTQRRRQVGVGR